MKKRGLCVVTAVLLGLNPAHADEFVVDFKDPENHFRAGGAVAVGGRFEPSEGSLRAILPPGPLGRPGLDYAGQFQLVGDFEVTVSYEIKDLPRPEPPDASTKDYDYSNNVQLSLHEPGRDAIVYRNRRRSGEGYGYFCSVDGEMGFEHKPATDPRGRIGMRRVGGKLAFLHGSGDGPLVPLGAVEWGTESVAVPDLSVLPLRTRDGIDVVFRELRIKAGAIDWSSKVHSASRRGPWSWARWLALPALLIASAMVWRMGSRPGPKGTRTTAAPASGDSPDP